MTENSNELLDFAPVELPDVTVEIVDDLDEVNDEEVEGLVASLAGAIAFHLAVMAGTYVIAAGVGAGIERVTTWREKRRRTESQRILDEIAEEDLKK